MAHSRKVIEESFRNRYWAVQQRHVAQALQLKTVDLLAQAERTLKQAAELARQKRTSAPSGTQPTNTQKAAIG